METALALAFMVFAFGFFIFVINLVHQYQREVYERRLAEAREFGFGGKNQHTVKTLHDK